MAMMGARHAHTLFETGKDRPFGKEGDGPHVSGRVQPCSASVVPLAAAAAEADWRGPEQRQGAAEPFAPAPCFTVDTSIATDRGLRRAGALRAGDRVLTRDNGYQEIRWIGQRAYAASELQRNARLRPVQLSAEALSAPPRTVSAGARLLLVSPQHRVLLRDVGQGWCRAMGPGTGDVIPEGLVRAECLLPYAGVAQVIPAGGVRYVHFLFDRHEIVLSDGLWSESFRPDPDTLRGLTTAQATEIFSLFPELTEGFDQGPGIAARPLLAGPALAALTPL